MRRVTPLFVLGGALALGACGSGQDSVTGKALVDPCAGQEPCFWAGEERPKGRTFGFGASDGNMRVFVSDPE